MSMSSEVEVLSASQDHDGEIQICSLDVRECDHCKCTKSVAVLKKDNSKPFHLALISFKIDHSKLLAVLLDNLNPDLRVAANNESPPRSVQKAIPIFLSIKVLRL
ncbi:MAG: hypothetical protein A2Z88_09610 [Omnitrophica WOR_2 bacterium GWA2_47_8]|nr:MAG: hypothetical protein A2Z88_09610 [Omnitrophica WOR_2 bacterium GWA2_47_8]